MQGTEEVLGQRLDSVLRTVFSSGVPTIDLLSTDVEGPDIAVLKSLEFSQFDVKNVLVEEGPGDNQIWVKRFLGNEGFYRRSQFSLSSLYSRADSPAT